MKGMNTNTFSEETGIEALGIKESESIVFGVIIL